jgi:hypothetical protein
MTAGLFPDKVIGLAPTETAHASQKARIHSGAIGDKQPGSGGPAGDLCNAAGRPQEHHKNLENSDN